MRIDVVSGFLGSGKTSFINKILPHCEGKVAIIENEYGDTSIDGALIEGDLPVTELTAGCICCSLVGDFKKTIKALDEQWQPDRVIIEPSGVSCLTDVLSACVQVRNELGDKVQLGRLVTLVEAEGFEDYMDVFGVFYSDQIKNAHAVVLSHLDGMEPEQYDAMIDGLRKINPEVAIWSEDWRDIDGGILLDWVDSVSTDSEFCLASDERLLLNAKDTFGSCSFVSPAVWTREDMEGLFADLASGSLGKVLRSKGFFAGEGGKSFRFDFTPYNSSILECEDAPKVPLGTMVFIGCSLDKGGIEKRVMR